MLIIDYEVIFNVSAMHTLMIFLIETERVREVVKNLIVLIHIGVSQITAFRVPFRKVIDVVKELEMIRREGCEQYEDKRDHHLGYLSSAPPLN